MRSTFIDALMRARYYSFIEGQQNIDIHEYFLKSPHL